MFSSIKETSGSTIKLYPNPTKNIIYLDLGELEQVQVQLLHINGQLIQAGRTLSQQNSRLDLRTLPKGVYLLQLLDLQEVYIYKILSFLHRPDVHARHVDRQ